jgi:hypothetical protein
MSYTGEVIEEILASIRNSLSKLSLNEQIAAIEEIMQSLDEINDNLLDAKLNSD